MTTDQAERTKIGKYVAEHWNGDQSLAQSYWVNLILLVALFAALGSVGLATIEASSESLRIIAFGWLIFWPFVLALWIWGLIGTWRSASKHVQRGGKQGWASVAKVMIALGWLSLIGQMSSTISPQMTEYAKIAAGLDPLGDPATIQLAANGKSIEVKGAIAQGTAQKFANAIALAPNARTIVLDSAGGRIFEAQKIAELVRDKQLNTYVENKCLSACTMIFVAGGDRAATPNAKLGFHQPSFPGWDSNTLQASIAYYRNLYITAGVDAAFVEHALETPADDMWYPSHSEMQSAGVLNRISFGGETATISSQIKTYEGLQAAYLALPLFKSLKESQPSLFDQMVNAAWKAHERGASDAEINQAGRAVLSANITKILLDADDEVLLKYSNLIVEQMQAARRLNPEACALLIDGKLEIMQALPRELSEREYKLLQEAVQSLDASNRNFDQSKVAELMQRVVAGMSAEQVALYDKLSDTPSAVRCNALIDLWERIGTLPPEDRIIMMRYLWSEA